MRGEPRLRRRRAARADQLPELRQPGEAAHRLAAHASGRGLGDACRALGVPVVGGNVSLYNEGADGPIYPTPVVGMVGELPDAARAGRLGFADEGDAIALVGPFGAVAAGIGAGQAARRAAARRRCPRPTSRPCARAQAAVREAVRSGALRSRARRRRGRPRRRARRVLPRRRHRRAGRLRRCRHEGDGCSSRCSARARAASSVRAAAGVGALAREVQLTFVGAVGGVRARLALDGDATLAGSLDELFRRAPRRDRVLVARVASRPGARVAAIGACSGLEGASHVPA